MSQSLRKDYVGSLSALRLLITAITAGTTVEINGTVYTAVAGVKADNTEFSIDGDDATTAADLVDSITNDVRTSMTDVLSSVTNTGNAVIVTVTGIVKASTSNETTVKLSGNRSTLLSLASSVPKNNEVLKRINTMNAPYSVQATGAELYDKILIVSTAAIFNTIAVRTRIIWGGRQGFVTALAADTSMTFKYKSDSGALVETTKTMEDVIASGSLFVLDDLY